MAVAILGSTELRSPVHVFSLTAAKRAVFLFLATVINNSEYLKSDTLRINDIPGYLQSEIVTAP